MRNPIYNSSGTIDCEIEISPGDWVPFTASPDDVEAHGRAIYAVALEGGPTPYVAPVIPAITLAELRASIAPISPLQGILTLGEAEWGKVLAYRDHADTTWGERIIIDNAADWVRTSQNIAFFGHLLGYTDDQMDALFRAAAKVTA